MPEITFEQSKEFLNKISAKDKIVVIHDNDADGFCSGTIIKRFCERKKAKVEEIVFTRGINLLNKENLIDYNKIFITDIGPGLISKELSELSNKEILYIDHHPKDTQVPQFVLEYRTPGPIPSSRTAYELTGIDEWQGIIGTLCDYGHKYAENDYFISSFLKNEKTSLEDFQNNYVYVFSNFLTYFKKEPEKIIEIIKKINSLKDINLVKSYSDAVQNEIDKTLKEFKINGKKIGNINYFGFSPKYDIKSTITSMISSSQSDKVFVFANPSSDGKISISARCQSRKIDMAELLKKCTDEFSWKTAGGHIPAAGATILSKDFEKFKENLKNFKF